MTCNNVSVGHIGTNFDPSNDFEMVWLSICKLLGGRNKLLGGKSRDKKVATLLEVYPLKSVDLPTPRLADSPKMGVYYGVPENVHFWLKNR